MRPNVVALTGPTASGKSRLALRLAEDLNAEIVNADSVQVYSGFDIGSGKPSAEELAKLPHHLYSIREADNPLDAEQFKQIAGAKIDELHNRSVLPLLVGGSGLYLRSVLCGLVPVSSVPEEIKEEIRRYENNLREEGLTEEEVCLSFHRRLASLDPEIAARLHPNDLVRVKRALEVHLHRGESLAVLQQQHAHSERAYRALVIALLPQRDVLYRAIESRVDAMLKSGLLAEAESLSERFGLKAHPLGAIGYRHALQFLTGTVPYEEMVTTLKKDTRNYAKRQMTWWRNQPDRLGWQVLNIPGSELTNVSPARECALECSEEVYREVVALVRDFLQLNSNTTEDTDGNSAVIPQRGIAFLPLKTKDIWR